MQNAHGGDREADLRAATGRGIQIRSLLEWRGGTKTPNLTTSYKDQLLEVNFTTNLTTDPALKDEIDKIIASVAPRGLKRTGEVNRSSA